MMRWLDEGCVTYIRTTPFLINPVGRRSPVGVVGLVTGVATTPSAHRMRKALR